jgi:23S rRNA (adenine-N6)-dimethyltransferase
VASPPYGVTGALLHLLLQRRSSLVAADLVLQRAVVRRYAGDDSGRTYGTGS